MSAIPASRVGIFWSRVDQSGGPNACWPWIAGKIPGGYGAFNIGKTPVGVHRIAYMLSRGLPSLPTAHILHSCDNRACCNPAHLGQGSNFDNMLDRNLKGRAASCGGHERQLTIPEVKEIYRRAWAGDMVKKIAEDFDMSISGVSGIKHGRTWFYITGHKRQLPAPSAPLAPLGVSRG